MKNALIIVSIALLLAGCGQRIEQHVKDLGCDRYVLETHGYPYFLSTSDVSYQLVYFDREYNSYSHNFIYIWVTKKPISDSIKLAQREFAVDKVRKYKEMMK